MSRNEAIEIMEQIADVRGIEYVNDDEAIKDFIVVFWAWAYE